MVLRNDKRINEMTVVDPDISRIGDPLIDSGVLNEEEVAMAAQVCERESKLIGEVFVELGILSQEQLNAVLDVQRLLRVGLIFRRQAISTLQSMNKTSNLVSSLEKSLAEEVRKRLGEGEMLNSLTSKLNKRLQGIAHRLYINVLNGSFEFEQAIMILNICVKDDCTVPEAAAKTGWTLSIQPTSAATVDLPEGEPIGWLTA